jgi:hypothetical protein
VPAEPAVSVNHLKLLRGHIKNADLQEAEICNYLKIEGIAKVAKLEDLNAELMEVLASEAHDLIAKVKKAKEQS